MSRSHWRFHLKRKLRLYLRLRRADALRVCLQSLFAAAIAYSLMQAIDATNVTWAVFASLFALQANVDRTLRVGVGQIVGAVGGSAVGVATLALFPTDGDTLSRLGLATFATSLASIFYPSTDYSIVVAAAVALEPSTGLTGALSRAIAIGLGSAVGIGVSIIVWPRFARSRAFDLMADLVDDCRDLLSTLSLQSSAVDGKSTDSIHARFLRRLIDARLSSGDARVRPHLKQGPTLYAVLDALETLWHGLVLLDRVMRSQRDALPERETLTPATNAILERADGYLQQVAAYLRGDTALPEGMRSTQPIGDACAALAKHIDAAHGAGHLHRSAEIHALSTLLFAFEQVSANLRKLATLLDQRE